MVDYCKYSKYDNAYNWKRGYFYGEYWPEGGDPKQRPYIPANDTNSIRLVDGQDVILNPPIVTGNPLGQWDPRYGVFDFNKSDISSAMCYLGFTVIVAAPYIRNMNIKDQIAVYVKVANIGTPAYLVEDYLPVSKLEVGFQGLTTRGYIGKQTFAVKGATLVDLGGSARITFHAGLRLDDTVPYIRHQTDEVTITHYSMFIQDVAVRQDTEPGNNS